MFNALGPRQVRPAAQHRRPEQAGGHSAGLRAGRHPQDHLHRRRRRHRVLEPLCRGDADGRPRHLLRPAPAADASPTARRTASAASCRRCRPTSCRSPRRRAPAGSFDAAAAARGKLVFEGKGQCASCHSGSLFTDANTLLHPPADSVAEPETPSYASRSATKMYRTSPLKGVWQHAPYFHDGSAATLEDVGTAYNTEACARPDGAGDRGPGAVPEIAVTGGAGPAGSALGRASQPQRQGSIK